MYAEEWYYGHNKKNRTACGSEKIEEKNHCLLLRFKRYGHLLHSFSDQVSYYSTRKRENLEQMIRTYWPARTIRLSWSRSAIRKNMTDSFTNIRQIKESGTEIYFEKENIWTFDVKGEQLLIIMNSLPQEEARNISKNTIWRGQRKRFADDNYYLSSESRS